MLVSRLRSVVLHRNVELDLRRVGSSLKFAVRAYVYGIRLRGYGGMLLGHGGADGEE
jgi:hypothetical protein